MPGVTRLRSSPPIDFSRWLVALICIASTSTGWGLTQGMTGTLHGHVVNEHGTDVGHAVVTVHPLDGAGPGLELETSEDGTYDASELAGGVYTVTATADDLSGELFRVRVRPGRTVRVNFRLTRGPGDASWLTELGNREAASRAFARGLAANRAGDPSVAVAQFARAVDLRPDCSGCFYNLAIAYVKLERYDDAETAFKQVTTLTPDYAAAYYGLATIYSRQQRETDAAAARDEATRLALANLAVRRQRLQDALDDGIALLNSGNVPGARARFESLVTQDSAFTPAYYWLGVTLLSSDESDQAVVAFRRYLQRDSEGEYAGQAQEALLRLGH